MKAFLTTLLLAFSLSMFSSCKKSNPVETNPVDSSRSNQIWPLQVGNNWVLRYTGLDTSGNILDSRYDTLLVTRDTLMANSTLYEVSGLFGGLMGYNDSSISYWMGGHGVYVTGGGYWYPANVGLWYYDNSMGSHCIYVQSTDTALTVPQGTHSCYEYEYVQRVDSVVLRKDFLSPGVGPVQIEMYDYIDTSSHRLYCNERWQLASVTLK